MLEILGGLSTRVKTGIILIIAMLIIGYIDSYFLFLVSVWNYANNCCKRSKRFI